ncbi:MAG: glycosyltransferase family 4 protein [Solirubrobacterales bacterium]|nr:glycosyltransferase family 4 protein [Solirubrobacterales bacterium]
MERWARELTRRLPELAPGRYEVVRPRPGLVHRAGHAWEQGVLPFIAARAGARALLCPANLAPLAFRRNVVVMHDAAVLRHPEWYSRAYAAWQARVLPALAGRALHVVTVSEFSRSELVDLLDLSPQRISVVYGGVDERFSPLADPEPARAALGLRRPYVLCVASHSSRKNLGALVPAAGALAGEGIEIAVAGGHRPQFTAETALRGLKVLGGVGDELLPGLYAGAEAFVLPSAYEGFGLPVVEAMASGLAVVAADATALPETAGGAARLVPPNASDLCDALVGLLGDPTERARLEAAGLQRARAFSWNRTARAVDRVLSDSAGRPSAWGSPPAGGPLA